MLNKIQVQTFDEQNIFALLENDVLFLQTLFENIKQLKNGN